MDLVNTIIADIPTHEKAEPRIRNLCLWSHRQASLPMIGRNPEPRT